MFRNLNRAEHGVPQKGSIVVPVQVYLVMHQVHFRYLKDEAQPAQLFGGVDVGVMIRFQAAFHRQCYGDGQRRGPENQFADQQQVHRVHQHFDRVAKKGHKGFHVGWRVMIGVQVFPEPRVGMFPAMQPIVSETVKYVKDQALFKWWK